MEKINYQLRPATEADYPYCYDLLKQNMFDLFSRHWGGWNPNAFREDFHAEDTTIVAISDRDVGFFSLRETDSELHLENIQLAPSVQGRGIGTAILERILQSNTSKPIQLITFTDNPAISLYKRLGFEVTEREQATVHMLRPVVF